MSEVFCALCQSSDESAGGASPCPECGVVYHNECYEENGGCGTYGCSKVPPPPSQAAAAVAPAVWGQETKKCPQCGEEIKAAALRCRHCSAEFRSVEAISEDRFRSEKTDTERLEALRRSVITVFVGGVIPCTSPIILVAGPLFLFRSPALFRKLAPVHRLLAWLGLGVSALWVLMGIAVMILSPGRAR